MPKKQRFNDMISTFRITNLPDPAALHNCHNAVKGGALMRKRKLIPLVLGLMAAFATFLAASVAYASPPWILYQPKAPKSILK